MSENLTMKTVQVYDKPMCCTTGICGPDVDPVLPRFAADLEWLKSLGHRVERYNLAQQPTAFIENNAVHRLISTEGTNCLPLVSVDGVIVSRQEYPNRDSMAAWLGSCQSKAVLPLADADGGCCGPQGCC
jgi:hypothetical protein